MPWTEQDEEEFPSELPAREGHEITLPEQRVVGRDMDLEAANRDSLSTRIQKGHRSQVALRLH